jgi:hypothetical protein
MSRIYDELKRAQRERMEKIVSAGDQFPEHRSSPRVEMRVPVFVYGHGGDAREPFHEETTSIVVNANGALVALNSRVEFGQRLLLTNAGTYEERQCQVVHVDSAAAPHAVVAIAFSEPSPDFWTPAS